MKRIAAATTLAFMLLAPSASGAGVPGIAALQVGRRQHGFSSGAIDWTLGAGTVRAPIACFEQGVVALAELLG